MTGIDSSHAYCMRISTISQGVALIQAHRDIAARKEELVAARLQKQRNEENEVPPPIFRTPPPFHPSPISPTNIINHNLISRRPTSDCRLAFSEELIETTDQIMESHHAVLIPCLIVRKFSGTHKVACEYRMTQSPSLSCTGSQERVHEAR